MDNQRGFFPKSFASATNLDAAKVSGEWMYLHLGLCLCVRKCVCTKSRKIGYLLGHFHLLSCHTLSYKISIGFPQIEVKCLKMIHQQTSIFQWRQTKIKVQGDMIFNLLGHREIELVEDGSLRHFRLHYNEVIYVNLADIRRKVASRAWR